MTIKDTSFSIGTMNREAKISEYYFLNGSASLCTACDLSMVVLPGSLWSFARETKGTTNQYFGS